MGKNHKKVIAFLMFMIFIVAFSSYGKPLKNFSDKLDVLYNAKIIDSKDDLDKEITRSEFAKMIVKASKNKDKATNNIIESVCNDVHYGTPYADYIKIAIDNSYMITYLGGLFKPDEYVKYSDLSRAALQLLGYSDEDFVGNKVIDRNKKFENLGLNENIDKSNNDILLKKDIVNGIYNTLKENIKDSKDVYALTVFDDMVLDKDNEIDALSLVETKIKGPYAANKEKKILIPTDTTSIYLNGLMSNADDVESDIYNYGYAIYYIDDINNILYAYTERNDVASPMRLIKGYVQNVYYSANDFTTPYRVDIDLYKLLIASEEMKFAFSVSGSFNIDDYVIVLCNKMNDVNKRFINSEGKIEYSNDESEPYNGSIVNAFYKSFVE